MPIHHEIDRRRALIRTLCTGAVNLDEVSQHFRTLEAEREIPEPLDVLLDLMIHSLYSNREIFLREDRRGRVPRHDARPGPRARGPSRRGPAL